MHVEIGDGLSRFDDFTLGLCVRFLVQGVQEMSLNLLRLVRFSNGLNALAANSRSFHDGLLGLNSGNGSWGRELRGQAWTVTHCCSAPRPPLVLVVTQTVSFSAKLSEFSAALSLSAR